jgi:hypothetical protein
VRDFHDLITLATSVRGCWSALRQAARERRDPSLEAVCRACDAETIRSISWLETKLRQSAPQALTVPSDTARELAAWIPSRGEVAAVADQVPGPALRSLLPLAPAAGVVVLLLAVVLGVRSATPDARSRVGRTNSRRSSVTELATFSLPSGRALRTAREDQAVPRVHVAAAPEGAMSRRARQ